MTDQAPQPTPERGDAGKFAPGTSGNPGGKAPGTRHRASQAIEQLMEGQAEALGQKAVEMALGGDSLAMRLCLERLVPVRRTRPVHFRLPKVTTAQDVTAAIGAVLEATGEGDLTPEEAATVAGILDVKRRAIETTEIIARLDALEKAATDRGDR